MRKTPIAMLTGAVLCGVAAPVVRFGVLPELRQVPASLDQNPHYSGTASLLNASALAGGGIEHAFLKDLPVTATQNVKVTSVHGGTAVMSDKVVVDGPDSKELFGTAHTWAVDRVDLEAATAPEGSGAEAHTGLVIGFPLQPSARNYQYWDSATQTTTTATYTRTEPLHGRRAYVYTVHAAGPMKDPQTLAAMPTTLPKETLTGLSASLPAAVKDQLTAMLPKLPAAIPLTYQATTDTTLWVDTATGWVLESSQQQIVLATLSDTTGAATPLAPVLSVDLRTTDDTVADNARQASSAQQGLTLIGTIAPLVLLVLLVLLAAGATYLTRRRGSATEHPADESVSVD